MTSFEQLGLRREILDSIRDLGFEQPSEIQEKAIPVLLEKGGDLLALAQTGTGKTAAFGFPLLQLLDPQNTRTQALILTPTRELCLQICRELEIYAKYLPGIRTVAVYGGASITAQADQIKRGSHIVVATPGRLKDMIGRKMVNISEIRYCVLDEADEMLNMGFYEDIRHILAYTPQTKSTWLFSATMPAEVSVIADEFMSTPTQITVGTKNTSSGNIAHHFYVVGARNRYATLRRLVDANPGIFSVIFCRTRRDTQRVAEQLIEDGYNAGALHGELSQNQRDMVMNSFRKRQLQILVATDVAARGLDIDDITHVIHYQLPDETETYTHRSGRTGRAGKSGVSMTLVTRTEVRKIKSIEKIVRQPFHESTIPSGIEICEIQLYHLASRIRDTEVSEDIGPFLPAIVDLLDGLNKEELIRKIVSVEFGRFSKHYLGKGLQDEKEWSASAEESDSGDTQRYFINIGEKDGFDWASLKDYVRDQAQLSRDQVSRVATKGSFSFFNVDSAACDQVERAFERAQLNGRPVNVERSGKNDLPGGKKRPRKGGGKPFKNERSAPQGARGKGRKPAKGFF